MLKSMKLLPDVAITIKTTNDFKLDKKGKRKASDCGDSSRARKKVERDDDDNDNEQQEEAGGSGDEVLDMETDD
jgi:hypothetical protein